MKLWDFMMLKLKTSFESHTVDAYPFSHVPHGIIVAWYNTPETIPDGWAYCDGTNGTPDLRDRVLVGANQINLYEEEPLEWMGIDFIYVYGINWIQKL